MAPARRLISEFDLFDTRTVIDDPLPLLWIDGPSGVGKTTVGWELFRRLSREGMRLGYVDIDQIGMCYAAPTAHAWAPEPASDRVRYRLKNRSLDAVAARLREAGAQGLLVSGIVDPARGIDEASLPHAAVTACRLRVDRDEHLGRLAVRGRPGEPLDEILQDAEHLDRSGLTGIEAGIVVDTTGLDVPDAIDAVRAATAKWPGAADAQARTPTGDAAGDAAYGGSTSVPGEILWLCGPTAVGKSTVGWSVYRNSRLAGHHTAFLDLDQIGFLRPARLEDPGNHRLKAGNLAGIWRNYSASGARRMVVVGPLDRPEAAELYHAALPEATITICRMDVGRAQLSDRVMRRGRGEAPGAGIPGDELKGLPQEALIEACDRAWAEAEALTHGGIADISVATDDRTDTEIAEEILRRSGW